MRYICPECGARYRSKREVAPEKLWCRNCGHDLKPRSLLRRLRQRVLLDPADIAPSVSQATMVEAAEDPVAEMPAHRRPWLVLSLVAANVILFMVGVTALWVRQ